jgi:hypothetical protein
LDYRLVASPRATALRSVFTYLALCTLLGCAKGGTTATGGSNGSGGSSSSGGVTGSGGANATGGSPGTGGSPATGGSIGSTGGIVGTGGSQGTGGSPATGGSPGTGGKSATGGSPGTGGTSISDAGFDATCQTADFKFVPQIPTVYLLVDRSGSMFHCLSSSNPVCPTQTDTSWYTLKTAIESVIKTLDSNVRFGFTTIWGTNPAGSGGMCPSLQATLTDSVPPALNNAATITTKYDSLAWPTASGSSTPGMKFESPASESIGNVAKALMADTDPGPKYIIFLTDGQPDYCDDSLAICAIDSVIYHLQVAQMAGINTIVFGVLTTQFDLPAGTLQAFANAGAGEPTLAPVASGQDVNAFYDQCNGNAGWAADLTASGKTKARGTSLGTYSTTMGTTKPYQPSASDETQLTTQLSAALAGVKSCSFDLSDVGGKSIKVDTTKLSSAVVKIQGTAIPLDATNGWNVDPSAPSTLVLSGNACKNWQTPNNNDINFAFPCSTIIFE